MKVLVAYASKAGSTKEIAEFIGEKLRARGVPAEVAEAASLGDVRSFDAFVMGSAVYNFHWLKEAKEFVERNRATLSSHPVWLFSSGPTGPKATVKEGRDLKEVWDLKEINERIHPRGHRIFLGAFFPDRVKGTAGWFGKWIPKEEQGDFRNWNDIEAWANSIAGALLTAESSLTVDHPN